jgi:hypothetical protein
LYDALLGDVSALTGTEGQAARLCLESVAARDVAAIEPVILEMLFEKPVSDRAKLEIAS